MLEKIDRKNLGRIIAILTLILFAVYLFNHFELNKLATRENIELYLKPFGPWIPAAFIIIFIISMIFYIPASVFLITIGTLLGPLWGTFWGLTGCYSASLILFLLARKFDYRSIQNKLGNKWEKFNFQIEKDGYFYIALIRALQIIPFSIICYGSAVTTIKLKEYVKGTALGCIPQVLLYCYTIPMVISQKFSRSNFILLAALIFSWLSVLGISYYFHKKQKLKFKNTVLH